MPRIILSVVAGYASMVLVIVPLFFGMAAIGVFGDNPTEAPQPPSTLWTVVILTVGLLAASVAGYVCAYLAKHDHRKAVVSLIVLTLLMWVFSSFSQNDEPLLMRVGHLVTGFTGVLIGWSVRKRQHAVTELDAAQTA